MTFYVFLSLRTRFPNTDVSFPPCNSDFRYDFRVREKSSHVQEVAFRDEVRIDAHVLQIAQ